MKNVIVLFIGVLLGSGTTFLLIRNDKSPDIIQNAGGGTEEPISNPPLKQNNCNIENAKLEFGKYYKFYIDDATFYVLPESILIMEREGCIYDVKYTMQSRRFKKLVFSQVTQVTFVDNKVSFKRIQ